MHWSGTEGHYIHFYSHLMRESSDLQKKEKKLFKGNDTVTVQSEKKTLILLAASDRKISMLLINRHYMNKNKNELVCTHAN